MIYTSTYVNSIGWNTKLNMKSGIERNQTTFIHAVSFWVKIKKQECFEMVITYIKND